VGEVRKGRRKSLPIYRGENALSQREGEQRGGRVSQHRESMEREKFLNPAQGRGGGSPRREKLERKNASNIVQREKKGR